MSLGNSWQLFKLVVKIDSGLSQHFCMQISLCSVSYCQDFSRVSSFQINVKERRKSETLVANNCSRNRFVHFFLLVTELHTPQSLQDQRLCGYFLRMCVGAKYVKRHSKPCIMSAKYGSTGATQYIAMMTNNVLTVAFQQFLLEFQEM